MFAATTIAIDVQSRVEKPTTTSISTSDMYTDEWFDKLFDDLNNHLFDKAVQDNVKRSDELIVDICDVHRDVEFDFDFEERDSDGEGYKGDDVHDLMPFRVMKTRNEPRETQWKRYTRMTIPYLEEAYKVIFAYHVKEVRSR